MNKIDNNRCIWLDIAKGITIILMVLGHTSIPVFVSNFIWSFHMPLFFIASGWTTNWEKYDLDEFCIRKCRSLILQFLIYSIIVVILMGGNFVHWLSQGWEGYALWFIPVLFLALIISRIVWMTKSNRVRHLLMVMLLVMGTYLSYCQIYLPWTICSVPYATFLVLSGTELKRVTSYIDQPRSCILFGCIILSSYISYYWHLDMASNTITPVIPLTIGAVSGTLMMFTISSFIAKYSKWCSNLLQAIGRETYIIVAFSQITIILLNQHFTLNTVVKYSMLMIVLLTLKYMKDGINKLAKTNIL
ncbi:MAG: acyltransferase family protein [Bacteroides sp.]|nr:acyltransferase family protein [Lachnospiraceae bacterium]MCM1372617.1 acyltransferase family protein [Bacteroides sp.]MCM1447168.1 acyltransferase family protein [Bacteroides sp.]